MSKLVVEEKKITFETPLNWKVMPGEEGVAVAICDELDMALQIEDGSPEEQFRQIMEAFRLLYKDLEQNGELEKFFEHHGVKVTIQQSIHKSGRRPIQKSKETKPTFEMSLGTLDVGPSSLKAHV